MRQLLIFLLSVLFMAPGFAQVVPPAPPVGTAQAYLLKSHNQRAAGRLLLIGGGAIAATTIVIASTSELTWEGLGLVGLGATVGTVAMLSSIPLFVAASRNKAKAKTAVSLQLNWYRAPQLPSSPSPAYPALTLRLSH